MVRRRVVEDSVSHERWLVSYADFITLLFAFFVVMYSISQVNEGKYKVLSNTLSEAFSVPEQEVLNVAELLNEVELTLDPFQVGDVAKSNPLNFVELRNNAIIEQQEQAEKPENDNQGESEAGEDVGRLPDEYQQISESLGEALGHLINQDLITIRGDEQWLEIELKSALLFVSGDATLSTPALELLSAIVDILRGQTNLIRVEGFTDSVPVNTPLFPSNWELSTARAAAVVHLFVEEGIDPAQMAATGYGQYQPIADNDTTEGRAANRRVVLRIAKSGELRPALEEVDVLLDSTDEVSPTDEQLSQINSTEEEEKIETQSEDSSKGVKTIELEGGGLLFTSEPEPE